jgi:ATP-binding protein involved in chromosome partitioning
MSDLNSKVYLALAKVIDPELRRPITELDMVDLIEGTEDSFSVTIKLTVSHCPQADYLETAANAALADSFPKDSFEVLMSVMTKEELAALKLKLRDGKEPKSNPFTEGTATKVFLIGSGKGGVGKSSITVNIAVELAKQGYEVGVIDADIFGFSIPDQLGTADRPTRLDDMILPPLAHGVRVISIGMFLPGNEPVAWRGPMLHKAVEQFLTEVYWGNLDFLLIDMPPGTGDVAISVGQLLPTAKTIVVTTPQQAAATVAERSGTAGLKTGQEIFGVIENMSYLSQPDGEKLELFGSGGGDLVVKSLSERTGTTIKLLGKIPLSIPLREGSDAGKPVVLDHPEDAASQELKAIAQSLIDSKLPQTARTLKVTLT